MAATMDRETRELLSRQAWDLRVTKHWSLRKIADELGIAHTTVQQMLRTVEQRLAKEFVGHAERIKARQSAQLEHMAAQALEQWYRSCGELVSVTVTSGRVQVQKLRESDGEGYTETYEIVSLPDLTTTATQEQTGNPQLLAQARGALEDIRAIWGMDAPKKTDVTILQQAAKKVQGMSDADLLDLLARGEGDPAQAGGG